ncbi:hypothetical protein Syun_007132 [Stephania yunnanensis]|uniref:Galactokinase N-terminal domain-containing protein n=1 Tax=Stephania yunnanensis TaxID=152371 RepID=A0AAP0KY32_9MAGN
MDTVLESSMAASASEASPSSTTTTPRSTSTPLSAPPSPAASPSHPTPSSNLPRISSIPVTISPPPPTFSSPRTGTLSAVDERGGWGGGGCVQCERCGEDSGVSEAGAAVVGGRWGFHGGRGDGDEVRLGLLKARNLDVQSMSSVGSIIRLGRIAVWIHAMLRRYLNRIKWISPCRKLCKFQLDEIMNKVAEMSGKCAKEVKVVISPYGICPLGAHIDHQITDFGISAGLENSVAMLLGSRFMACRYAFISRSNLSTVEQDSIH